MSSQYNVSIRHNVQTPYYRAERYNEVLLYLNNINREDALIEFKASILQEVIKALIIALYDAPDNKKSNKEIKP